MKLQFTFIAFFMIISISFAETLLLIADFDNQEGKRTNWGQDCFLFSDAGDGGNSIFINAVDSTGKGKYTDVRPTPDSGYNKSNCAMLRFKLGDICPTKYKDENKTGSYDPFAAFGINLVNVDSQGVKPYDMRDISGIRFWAQASESLTVFVEVVTNNISGWRYYRSYLIITPNEGGQLYTVPFDTATSFKRPPPLEGDQDIPRPCDFSQALKINWHISTLKKIDSAICAVTGVFPYKQRIAPGKEGFLALDEIYLIKNDVSSQSFARFPSTIQMQRHINKTYNLLGRKISVGGRYENKAPAFYILKRQDWNANKLLFIGNRGSNK